MLIGWMWEAQRALKLHDIVSTRLNLALFRCPLASAVYWSAKIEGNFVLLPILVTRPRLYRRMLFSILDIAQVSDQSACDLRRRDDVGSNAESVHVTKRSDLHCN